MGRILDLSQPIFSEKEASLIVKNILIGLSKVHELNLVHRDIKPENIIIRLQQAGPNNIEESLVDVIGDDPDFSFS